MDASYKTPTDSRRHTHHTKIKPFLNKTNSTSKLKEKEIKKKFVSSKNSIKCRNLKIVIMVLALSARPAVLPSVFLMVVGSRR